METADWAGRASLPAHPPLAPQQTWRCQPQYPLLSQQSSPFPTGAHILLAVTDHKQVNKQTEMGLRALGNTSRSGAAGGADGKEKSWKGCSAKRGHPDSGVHGCWGFGRGGHRAVGQVREMAQWLSSWPVSGGLTWGGRCNRSRAQSLAEWEESGLATSVGCHKDIDDIYCEPRGKVSFEDRRKREEGIGGPSKGDKNQL